MKASIIIPMYNASSTIEATLESIAAQTRRPDEVIVVDDGSTDGSAGVAEQAIARHGMSDYARVERKANGGAWHARNHGLSLVAADTDRVLFVDSDDIVAPLYLETLLAEATDDEEVVSICGMRHVFSLHEKYDMPEAPFEVNAYDHPFDNPRFVRRFEFGLLGTSCTKAYSMAIIRREGLRFERELPEDCRFNIEYLQHCRQVRVVEAPLYIYIHRPGSITSAPNKELFDNYLIIGETLNSLVSQPHREGVRLFLYGQFRAIISSLILAGQADEARGIIAHPVVKDAFAAYRPVNIPDALAHNLLRHGMTRSYRLMRRLSARGR